MKLVLALALALTSQLQAQIQSQIRAQPAADCRLSPADPDAAILACTRAIAVARQQIGKCEQQLVWAASTRHPDRLPDSATATPDCPDGRLPDGALATFYTARGQNLAAKTQYGPALRDMRRALLVAPSSALIHFDMGSTNEAAGHLRAAAREYGQSIRLNPDDPAEWVARCRVRAKLGKQKDAAEDCDRALALAPNDAGALAARRSLPGVQNGAVPGRP